MRYELNNKLYYAANALIFILIVCCCAYFSRYNAFFADDLGYSLYPAEIRLFETLNPQSKFSAFYVHGGGYLCLFLTRFFNAELPYMLNIHPADFIGIPEGIIKGAFASAVFFMISKFSVFQNKSKILMISAYIFSFSYFLYFNFKTEAYLLAVNHSFYRYIFPLLLLLPALNFIYKTAVLKLKLSYNQMAAAAVCALLLGASNEFIFYTIIFFCIILIIYNSLIKTFFKNADKDALYALNGYFYKPFAFLIISASAFVFSPGSLAVMDMRGLGSINITMSDIKEFTALFFKNCVFDISAYWIVYIFALAAAVYSASKNKKLKEVLFPLFYTVSLCSFMYSLILCGKTFYNEGGYWILHANLITLYYTLLLIPLYMYLDFTAVNTDFLKHRTKAFGISALLISAGLLCAAFKNTEGNFYHQEGGKLSKIRAVNYIADKISRYMLLSDADVILPIQLKQISPEKLSYYIWLRGFEDYQNADCTKTGVLITNYYPLMYKEKVSDDVKYCFSGDAAERFYNLGGYFTYDELKNINFGRLKNNDFLFNQNIKKHEIIPAEKLNQDLFNNLL